MLQVDLVEHDGSTETLGTIDSLDGLMPMLGEHGWEDYTAVFGITRAAIEKSLKANGHFYHPPFGNDLGINISRK